MYKYESNSSIILCKKYRLMDKIGSGSFGSIYMRAYRFKTVICSQNRYYHLSQEKKGKGDGQLQYQIKLYQIFQGIPGICKLYDFGHDPTQERLYMIIDLLGQSLEDLFQLCGKKFSVGATMHIAIQIITRLQNIHRKGFVHRDIKANNFTIGRNEKIKTVYVIDFGLAKKFRDLKTGIHIPIKGGKTLVGTARYASIASHEGFQQCRRDDLESLGFMLLYFLKGKLPWQGIQVQNKQEKYAIIGNLKKTTSIETFCSNHQSGSIPIVTIDIFVKYFKYVRSLIFQQQPNYDFLKKLFKEELIKRKEQSMALDWEKHLAKKQLKNKYKV